MRVSSIDIRGLPRIVDHDDPIRRRLPLEQYFSQNPPVTTPILIEHDYLEPSFWRFAEIQFSLAGVCLADVQLGYSVVDICLSGDDGANVVFPFIFCSRFEFNDKTIYGPFVAGHQAGISMVQSGLEPTYARYVLPERHWAIFNSNVQTKIISEALRLIIEDSRVDGFIAALPNRSRDPDFWMNSNIARVLTGGHITDCVSGLKTLQEWGENPLKGEVFSLTEFLFREMDVEPPEHYKEFYYYSFLDDQLRNLVFNNKFLLTIDVIRRLGPAYRAAMPEESEGVLFDPEANLVVLSALFDRFVE